MKKNLKRLLSLLTLLSIIFGISILSSKVHADTAQQQKVVQEAKKYLGVPYVWGGNTPAGFDCSGLTQYVYSHAVNIPLPRVTTAQEKVGSEVSLNSLQPGDLLFYGMRGNTTHVGIYIGNNKMIHAPQPGQNVTTVDIKYYYPDFARRILSSTPAPTPNNDGQKAGEQYVFRLYNPNAGQHVYMTSVYEATQTQKAGWTYEEKGGWVAPTTGSPVYRLYNKTSGEHYYTMSSYERDSLVKAGWNYEQVSFYSGGTVPVYCLFNPNAKGTQESHAYTVSSYEKDSLVSAGWRYEKIAFYALRTR